MAKRLKQKRKNKSLKIYNNISKIKTRRESGVFFVCLFNDILLLCNKGKKNRLSRLIFIANYARSTFPLRKHLVHTYSEVVVPSLLTTLTLWTFAPQDLLVLRWLWLTILPLICPFPQTLHTLDILQYLLTGIKHKYFITKFHFWQA